MDNQTKKTLAWVGLFLNIFFLPGAGTILAGKYLIGAIQAILYLAIIIMDVIYFGDIKTMMVILIPGILIWLWAMITSIIIIRKLKTVGTGEQK